MKYNDNGTIKEIKVKAFDTLPIGTEVDYDGETVPTGWTEVADPNTYSTDEVRIGTWIDGKPLYRKILSGAMPQVTTDGTTATTTINIPDNLDFVFCEWGFAKGYVNNYNYVIPIVGIRHDAPSQYVTYNIYSRNIELRSSRSSWNSFTAYFSLLYTKTTD